MIDYKKTKRLVIVIDVPEYSVRGRKPTHIATDLLTADGEYDYNGTLIHAVWIEEENDRSNASPGGGGQGPG
jgi:hypothetical protein